jgi:hypothetical protein
MSAACWIGGPVNGLLSVTTFGETFGDGAVIEAISPVSSSQLTLLFRNATKKSTARRIQYAGRIYCAPELDETLRHAIRFPHIAKNYGSTEKLFHRIRDIFSRHGGLTDAESSLMTAWVTSSWCPDLLSSPPALFVSGADMAIAVGLFRLLHCLCRRAVVLGGVNRNAFLSLGPISATLLINGPSLSPEIRDLWNTSNYRGVHVFGNGGVYSLASSKAVFTGMADPRYDEGVHLALRPGQGILLQLTELQLSEIAGEIQPRLLMYRLKNFQRVRDFSASERALNSLRTETVRALAASVMNDPEILRAINPLLKTMEQETTEHHGGEVHVAVIEASWAASHEVREIAISKLTGLANALLRCRDETRAYSPSEVGWRLRNLGLSRHRNAKGKVLQFSRENRVLIHQLATTWGLKIRPVADCSLCCPEGTDARMLM